MSAPRALMTGGARRGDEPGCAGPRARECRPRDGGDYLAGDAGARLAVRSRLKDDGRGAEITIAAAYLLFVKHAATARGEPLNGASRHQPQAA
jgi:hypothetical protein